MDATAIIIFVPPTIRPNSTPVDVDAVVVVLLASLVVFGSVILGPTILNIAT